LEVDRFEEKEHVVFVLDPVGLDGIITESLGKLITVLDQLKVEENSGDFTHLNSMLTKSLMRTTVVVILLSNEIPNLLPAFNNSCLTRLLRRRGLKSTKLNDELAREMEA